MNFLIFLLFLIFRDIWYSRLSICKTQVLNHTELLHLAGRMRIPEDQTDQYFITQSQS